MSFFVYPIGFEIETSQNKPEVVSLQGAVGCPHFNTSVQGLECAKFVVLCDILAHYEIYEDG